MLNSFPEPGSSSKPDKPPLLPQSLAQNVAPFVTRERGPGSCCLGSQATSPCSSLHGQRRPSSGPQSTPRCHWLLGPLREEEEEGSAKWAGEEPCTAPGEACQRLHLARLPASIPHLAQAWR